MSCCKTAREAEVVRGFDPGWADLLARLHSATGCARTERVPASARVARWEAELDRSHEWLVNLDSSFAVRHATCSVCGATESSRWNERCNVRRSNPGPK